MSGLIGTLLNNGKALAAHSKGVELAGKNLANINNPDYARQRVILGDRGTINTALGPQSMGVEALGIQQIRDQFLDSQVARENSQTSLLQTQSDNLQRTQADLGEQIDSSSASSSIGDPSKAGTGLSSALNDFFNSFDNLSASPTDTGAKQVLLQKADILVAKFNVTDSRLAQQQSDITARIDSDVTAANSLLKDIADLNGQIQTAEVTTQNTAVDLRDQRQAKLEKLANYMDFSTQAVPGTGMLQILAHDSSGANVTLVDKANVIGPLSFNGTQFSGGSPASALGLQGGSLKGNLDSRDGAIQQLRDDIKTTAQQLVSSVNKAYNPTGTTGDFFQSAPPATGILALDSSLTFNTLKTTDTGNSGANELALAVAAVASKTHTTAGGDAIDGTIGSFYSRTVSGFGQTVAGVESKLTDQKTVQTLIKTQRDSVSGVSQDEELTDLMKFQRAFQATARVVNVLDGMLDTVVNGLIR